jgi:hypothetical protein
MSSRSAEIVDLAWKDLPRKHRVLLESIGCEQRKVVCRPLGQEVDDLHQSAGLPRLSGAARRSVDRALGVWVRELRVVLLNAKHEKFDGLNSESFEAALARVVWHEWGHALSLDRATEEDVRVGPSLLKRAPAGIVETIRGGGYGSREITHELVAEIYAVLMARRRRGFGGKPPWLADDVWELMARVTGWIE